MSKNNFLLNIKEENPTVFYFNKELKNFEFPFNLVELIQMKNNLIKNNFDKYKMNLINIEKTVFQIGYESLFPNNNRSNLLPVSVRVLHTSGPADVHRQRRLPAHLSDRNCSRQRLFQSDTD